MITVDDYFMGRDKVVKYKAELTPDKRASAMQTVARINQLLAACRAYGIGIDMNPNTGTPVSSGWRPAQINSETAGAAPRSKHIICQACDIYDPEGEIDQWAIDHPEILAGIGLWQEHPSCTKSWAHFQIVAPKSGRRVFYP